MMVPPVCRCQTALDSRCDTQGVARPGEEGISLGDLPVGGTIQVQDRECCVGRLGCNKSCHGGGGRYALVEEWHGEESMAEGREESEGRLGLSNGS